MEEQDMNINKGKMEVSKIIKQILSERESEGQNFGINWEDTSQVLSNVLKNCENVPGTLKNKFPKAMTRSLKDEKGIPLMSKFPEIWSSGKESVAYVGGDDGSGRNVVVFGIVDTLAPDRALLTYDVTNGAAAQRNPNGVGRSCRYVQQTQNVGKVMLSDIDKSKLTAYFGNNPKAYSDFKPENALNYEEVPLCNLKDKQGKPLVQNCEKGSIWVQRAAGKEDRGNVPEMVHKYLADQGFTKEFSKVGLGKYGRLGFYLSDILGDDDSLQMDQKMAQKEIYYPTNEINIDPTKDDCRKVITKLSVCMNEGDEAYQKYVDGKAKGFLGVFKKPELANDIDPNLGACMTNLIANKITALRCRASVPNGLTDEYTKLLQDGKKYGLAKLRLGVGQARYENQLESLDKKINKILNEERKNFTFNSKPQPKVEFDKELVETISTQLVISAYFDLQKSMKKLDKLNENAFGSITSGLGFNLGDKLMQGGKEVIAKKIIGYLGFNPDDYISLLLVNIFANLDIADYPKFISDCKKFTAVIVKSALEAWLDKAAKTMSKGSMEGFVYSALKNTVTETAAQTTVFKKLEKLAATMVCPLVEGLADSVKNGSLNLF
jgi:hypothetical protein